MVKEVEGVFNYCQFNRFTVPGDVQRKLGLYTGWPKTYKEGKAMVESLPKEKRFIPYISASRVIVLFPPDADEKEVMESLEFLVKDLKRRWREKLQESI
jgi:hypothetical protein